MDTAKYSFSKKDLHITSNIDLDTDKIHSLVDDIFTKNIRNVYETNTYSKAIPLKASLSEITEGQSPAKVFELAFIRSDNGLKLCKYIVRAHVGTDAETEASKEKDLVKKLNFANSDYFSSNMVDEIFDFPGIIVYRHAEDQVGAKTLTLQDVILKAIHGNDSEVIGKVTKEIELICKNIIDVYNITEPQRIITSGKAYFSQIVERLYPDLVIDARKREIIIEDGVVTICSSGGESLRTGVARSFRFRSLMSNLSYDINNNLGWIKLQVWPTSNTPNRNGILRFASKGEGNERLWIRVSNSNLILEDRQYDLVLKSENGIVATDKSALKNLGFSAEARMSISEIEEFIETTEEIRFGLRHSDLHMRNVLSTMEGRLKVIDLSSTYNDLLVVSQARLEISVCSEMLSRFPNISSSDMLKILEAVQNGSELSSETMEYAAYVVFKLISAIRSGFRGDLEQKGHRKEDVVLGYVTQVLLFQRYYLEISKHATGAFNTVVAYWLAMLKNPSQFKLKSDTQFIDKIQQDSQNDVPLLGTLWRKALFSATINDIPEGKPLSVFKSLVSNNPDFMACQLTQLQRLILNTIKNENPFFPGRNVILAGPTSSGKSTIAEMFLAGPPLLNIQRTCSLYVAPTRALTQAKYLELRNRFRNCNELLEGIVISTGEDNDFDWNIIHGKFTIACMVYEKANILFSVRRKLLERLGCVVIDEIHMLTNLERGPILELAVSKVLVESRTIASEASNSPFREQIKVVAISTEDKPDDIFEEFLSLPNDQYDGVVKPIIFHAPERPVQVQHSLVLAGDEESKYKIFPVVKFSTSEDRSFTIEKLKQVNDALCRVAPLKKLQYKKSNPYPKVELRSRCISLLNCILSKNPNGHRILVFVPSKRDAEEWAATLKNEIKNLHKRSSVANLPQNLRHENVLRELEPLLSASEDIRLSSRIRECAAVGIFIHHADVERKIRAQIESICGKCSDDAPSQVIFSTETLSYGVNLAVNDVIICGTEL